jgi:sporadic carbohydrate cluster protein (TIGR04323 family)
MKELARGYNLSRSFIGNRLPQHIQNQIIKSYCDNNNLLFILSRSEYAINDRSVCQLWAALKEGIPHIVFYSVWQLPIDEFERHKALQYAMQKGITLHFACENLKINDIQSLIDIELTVKLRGSIYEKDGEYHLDHMMDLAKLI